MGWRNKQRAEGPQNNRMQAGWPQGPAVGGPTSQLGDPVPLDGDLDGEGGEALAHAEQQQQAEGAVCPHRRVWAQHNGMQYKRACTTVPAGPLQRNR